MSVLWFYTTIIAIVKVKQKDIMGHQKWMMRSFALSFAAVTLRILVPVFSVFTNDIEFIVVSTAWLSWMLNLLIVEGMIFSSFKPAHKLK